MPVVTARGRHKRVSRSFSASVAAHLSSIPIKLVLMALFMHQLADLTKLGVSTALLWAWGHLYVDSFVGQTMRRIQRN